MTDVARLHRHERPPIRTAARLLLLLSAVLGLAAAGLTPAIAAPPATRPATAAAGTLVALPTGDLVRLRTAPDGRQTAGVLARNRRGAAGSFRTERRNGDLYVIPALASPYLGRLLDPALFNVSQLARAGLTGAAGRFPVRLTYRAGAGHHAVPGVTITRTQGDTVDGYLTAASARQFGQALAAQARADAAAHWQVGGGIFAGLTGLRFAGPTATPPAQPHFPMFTLRILVTGADGQPAAFGDVLPVNTDDSRKLSAFPSVVNGEGRVSLPAGHYGLLVHTFDLVDDMFVDRFVNISDYQVTRAQTLAVDMRTATARLTAHTPRPGVVDDGDFTWLRNDVNGLGGGVLFGFGEGSDFRFAPGTPARVGTLNFSSRFHLTAPADAAQPYTYDLRFDSPPNTIPASLDYRVTDAELTTLHARYFADGRREAITTRFSFLPWLDFGFQALLPVTVPGERSEYVNGRPETRWQQEVIGFLLSDFSDPDNPIFILAAEMSDGLRVYQAGTEQPVDWARPPLRPSLDVDTGRATAPASFLCPACRRGDSIGIFLTPVADTVPGHFGFLDFPGDTPLGPVTSTSRWRLFRDGALVSDQTDVSGATVDVPATAANYRLSYDQTRTAPWYTQGTRSQSEWTFGSSRPTGSSVPASWLCAPRDDGSAPAGDCAVLPLLTINYAAPVDLTGTVPAGASHLGISVAPTQGAPAVEITGATVEVSFDDGASWTAATVTGGGHGQFDAAFTAPASGFVSTRVHATDAAGNTVTQTVIRAYTVGAGA